MRLYIQTQILNVRINTNYFFFFFALLPSPAANTIIIERAKKFFLALKIIYVELHMYMRINVQYRTS